MKLKSILLVSCLTSFAFSNEIASLKPVVLSATGDILTGVLFGQNIKINRSDNVAISLEEGFCENGGYGYRAVISSSKAKKKLVYDSCSEKDMLIDKNESLKEYPLAVFPEKIKINLDTTNHLLPTTTEIVDYTNPFEIIDPVPVVDPVVDPVVPDPTPVVDPIVVPVVPDPIVVPDPTPVVDPVVPDPIVVPDPTPVVDPVVPNPIVVPDPTPAAYKYDYTPFNFSGQTKTNAGNWAWKCRNMASVEQYTENMNQILIDSIYKFYELKLGQNEGRKEAEKQISVLQSDYLFLAYDYYDYTTGTIAKKNVYIPTAQNITTYTDSEKFNSFTKYATYDYLKNGYGLINISINQECNGPCNSDFKVPFYSQAAYDTFQNEMATSRTTPVDDNFLKNYDQIEFDGYVFLGNVYTKSFEKYYLKSKQTLDINTKIIDNMYIGNTNYCNNGLYTRETINLKTKEEISLFQKQWKATINDWFEGEELKRIKDIRFVKFGFYTDIATKDQFPFGYIEILYKGYQYKNGTVSCRTVDLGGNCTFAYKKYGVKSLAEMDDLYNAVRAVQ
jgi:hypothetical protein